MEALASGEVGVVTPIVCPKGYTCPSGTDSAIENPCPEGTYNDQLGSVDCFPCTAGQFG